MRHDVDRAEYSPALNLASGAADASSRRDDAASPPLPGAQERSRERILIVAQEFTLGGAAYLALRHARRLRTHYEIDLLVTGRHEEAMLCQLPAEVSVYMLRTERRRRRVDALSGLRDVLRQQEIPPFKRTYRAVLATSVFPDWRACLAVSLANAARKLVFLVDEGLANYARLPSGEQGAVASCLLAADLVLPVSRRLWQAMARQCPPLERRPWQVLRPPVDLDRPHEPTRGLVWPGPGSPVVLTVARLSPDKQIRQSLQVHHRLRQAGIEFRWYVVGPGTEAAALQSEIDRLGMADAFFLTGAREDVLAWMKRCDVFALLSSSEGCPTVVMEALAVGCPVIMTDVNGADELIDNGRTGLIVANEAEAIADGLARLVLDPGLRTRLRQNIAADPHLPDAAGETTWLVERIEEPVTERAEPLVSIIIPAFNHEQYIDRAIASALMQDFPSIEVIVADDASTDQTGAMARAWTGDPRLRYVRNERNLGRVGNYRTALAEHARGKWVLMLDGDDHLTDPGFIRLCWEALRRHAERPIVFVQAGQRVHYVHGEHGDVDVLPPIDGPERLMAGSEYLDFVYGSGFFSHLGTLYRRDLAVVHGSYTADISSSDMDSLLRLALEGEVLVLNTIAGSWVQHGGNASANLSLGEIAANVRIFRQIARMAAGRGLAAMPRMEAALTRYEAHTLAHLFGQTIGKSAHGPLAAFRMLGIVISVNPRLLLNRRVVVACRRYAGKLTRLALRRSMSGRRATDLKGDDQ